MKAPPRFQINYGGQFFLKANQKEKGVIGLKQNLIVLVLVFLAVLMTFPAVGAAACGTAASANQFAGAEINIGNGQVMATEGTLDLDYGDVSGADAYSQTLAFDNGFTQVVMAFGSSSAYAATSSGKSGVADAVAASFAMETKDNTIGIVNSITHRNAISNGAVVQSATATSTQASPTSVKAWEMTSARVFIADNCSPNHFIVYC